MQLHFLPLVLVALPQELFDVGLSQYLLLEEILLLFGSLGWASGVSQRRPQSQLAFKIQSFPQQINALFLISA